MPLSNWFKRSHAAPCEETDSITFIDAPHTHEIKYENKGKGNSFDLQPSSTIQFQQQSSYSSSGSNTSSSSLTDDCDSVYKVKSNMTTTSSPINIATPTRNASSSPSSQGNQNNSNYLDPDSRTSARIMTTGTGFDDHMGRSRQQESFAAAKPISMNNPNRNNDRPRRESLAGSLVGESHAQQTPASLRNNSSIVRARENPIPNGRSAIAAQATSAVHNITFSSNKTSHHKQPRLSGLQMPQAGASVGGIQLMRQQQRSQPATPIQKTNQGANDEMDGVEDMEMDDAIGPMDSTSDTPVQNSHNHQPVQAAQQSMFGQQPRPTINLNSTMQHSGLRTSQPPTPAASSFGFQNNPTVSSVNTPTLTAQPMQQSQTFSPETSAPGTPSEMDADFTISNGGGFNNQRALQQQFAQFGLGQGQFANNADLMRAYQQQQLMASMNGMGDPTGLMMAKSTSHLGVLSLDVKRLTRIKNGLKYHKTHGHQTQQLHENGDGTFSIVNPETSIPYSGNEGMEREKPYKCDFCGKRYKNLNGLKYHKQHSTPCDPELKLNSHLAAAGLGGLGVPMGGLPGIGEEGMM
ncbi:hypothetical protein DID88_008617 [Monilinia fructigena]|uniref:C2H2-type domain-containing protein n=1 Tax=Monilinia fructigena TaxID=38457 RepID=A0A395J5V7_9HELO|nr:hypothetical protein DID88_008617 [Monilinia fructigena]